MAAPATSEYEGTARLLFSKINPDALYKKKVLYLFFFKENALLFLYFRYRSLENVYIYMALSLVLYLLCIFL